VLKQADVWTAPSARFLRRRTLLKNWIPLLPNHSPTKELLELFPPRKEGGLLGGHKGTSEPIKRGGGGRPRKHDWDRFYIEIIARVALKVLPDTQAKLIKEMTQWFADKDNEPVPSEIKKRISQIHHRVNEQRQKAGNRVSGHSRLQSTLKSASLNSENFNPRPTGIAHSSL
jgi:hypothetical protein